MNLELKTEIYNLRPTFSDSRFQIVDGSFHLQATLAATVFPSSNNSVISISTNQSA